MKYSFEKVFSLEGRNVLITGGGSGLGLAMAQCMDEAGANVIIVGHSSEEKLQQATTTMHNASYYLFDITETDETPAFIERVTKEKGSIDVLVNNAGVHCKKPVEQITRQDLQNVLDVHVFASLALSQAVLPSMRERKSGNIIFISSMSAFAGLTSVAAYGTAKTGVLGLMRSMASEVAVDNVRVNAIAPGFIDTPMFRLVTDKDPARKAKILGHTPMQSFGTPEDIGWSAVYLASDASRFVTGTCLMVDGGFTIGF
jgi:NAD(P)-dependent dehydrogenase (short-subunit alcohol dehydrogenase family)